MSTEFFSSLFACDVELKSNYWRLCMIWLYFAWKYKCRDFFFPSMPLLVELVLFQLFTFNTLLRVAVLWVVCTWNCHSQALYQSSVTPVLRYSRVQGRGLLDILILTNYNFIPFFPNVPLSEASYTL